MKTRAGRQDRNAEIDEKLARDKEALSKVLVEEKQREQGETLSVLDALRRTRKARGGVGAPLQVPAHLKDASKGTGIIITDEDVE